MTDQEGEAATCIESSTSGLGSGASGDIRGSCDGRDGAAVEMLRTVDIVTYDPIGRIFDRGRFWDDSLSLHELRDAVVRGLRSRFLKDAIIIMQKPFHLECKKSSGQLLKGILYPKSLTTAASQQIFG